MTSYVPHLSAFGFQFIIWLYNWLIQMLNCSSKHAEVWHFTSIKNWKWIAFFSNQSHNFEAKGHNILWSQFKFWLNTLFAVLICSRICKRFVFKTDFFLNKNILQYSCRFMFLTSFQLSTVFFLQSKVCSQSKTLQSILRNYWLKNGAPKKKQNWKNTQLTDAPHE